MGENIENSTIIEEAVETKVNGVTEESEATNETGGTKNMKQNKILLLILRWVVCLSIALILIAICARSISKAFYTRHIVIHVTDKGVKRSGGEDKYMVYGKTIDGLTKVYEITDSMLAQRYDSDDRYANIQVGSTYEFIVGGNRIPILGWYPNIYSIFDVDVPDDSVWEIPPHDYRLKPAIIDETEYNFKEDSEPVQPEGEVNETEDSKESV